MKRLGGLKVIIVDDDSDLRELIGEEFAHAGAMVELAESGEAAIRLIKLEKFNFILSDMRMPHGNGKFLAEEVMKLRVSHRPLFFLYTGYSDITHEEALKLNILEVFAKPFSVSRIIDVILKHLKH